MRRSETRWTSGWTWGVAVWVSAGTGMAQSQATLDELLGLEPVAGDPAQAGGAAEASAAGAVAELLQGPALSESFEFAVVEMGQIADQLGAVEVGLPTQRLQQRVLDRLDQLIAAASSAPPPSSGSAGSGQGQPQPRDGDNQKNQPGQGQGQSQGQAQGPAQPGDATQGEPGGSQSSDGGFSPGQAQQPDAAPKSLDEMRSEWGALPPRLRDALSDGLDEPYSPIYRDATEAYYRQLAEEAGR